jgi:hypothetical protein
MPVPAPAPVPVPTPRPTPQLSAADRQAEALSAFGRYDCAGLSATIRGDGVLVVGGFVGSAADRDDLMARLAAIPGMAPVEERIAIHPPPICTGLQLLGGITSVGLRLDPNRADRTYRLGADPFTFRVNSNRRGVLKLAMMNTDGTITAPAAWSAIQVQAGQSVAPPLLPPGGQVLEPPAGQMLLMAVLSNAPLFTRPRPDEEPAETFFAALRDALSRAPDAQAAFAVIDTVQ